MARSRAEPAAVTARPMSAGGIGRGLPGFTVGARQPAATLVGACPSITSHDQNVRAVDRLADLDDASLVDPALHVVACQRLDRAPAGERLEGAQSVPVGLARAFSAAHALKVDHPPLYEFCHRHPVR